MSDCLPPPTTNVLQPSQRIRLRKSSRKIEAVLGATPFVLEISLLDDKSSLPRPPITPRTRARRRRGQLFGGSSSCSSSSASEDEQTVVNVSLETDLDADDSDSSDYVIVNPRTPHGQYLPHSLPDAVLDRSPGRRARSKSDALSKPKYNKTKPLPLPPLPPISHVQLDLPLAVQDSKPKKSVRPLPQPVIVPPTHHKPSPSISSLSSETTSPKSPLSSIFNMSPEQRDAQEKEMKRKKLAKLARTLGENVPPELVFPPNEKRPAVPKRVSVKRRDQPKPASVSTITPLDDKPSPPAPKKFQRAHRPRSLSVPLLFPSTTVEVEQVVNPDETEHEPSPITFAPPPTTSLIPPTPLAIVETRGDTTSYSKATIGYTRRRVANSLDSPRGRKAFEGMITIPLRPEPSRSNSDQLPLPQTLSPSRAPYVGRGATSLDIERPVASGYGHAHSASGHYQLNKSRSPLDYVYGKSRSAGHSRSHTTTDIEADSEELHRRKEREWSGEWNVKDMGVVVNRLRELRA